MTKKKRYFPNKWKAIKDAPLEAFRMPGPPPTFEEFMDWKIGGWEILPEYNCIIRERNLVTNKVTEYVYKQECSALKKIKKSMKSGECEFTICRADNIDWITPNTEELYDDPLA